METQEGSRAMEGVQGACAEGSLAMEGVQVEGTTRVHVKRPKITSRTAEAAEEEQDEEILVLQGVAVPADAKVKINVFISHKDHSSCHACHACSDCVFAGSFLIVPGRSLSRSPDRPPLVKSNHRLGISETLRELNIHGEDSFSLALVPASQPPQIPISIQSIRFEYE